MIDNELIALGQQIATHLAGWTFTADTADSWCYRVYLSKGGMKIDLHREKDRINIQTWDWPVYTTWERDEPRQNTVRPSDLRNPEGAAPSISVAMSRGAEVIAREITRRFIPDYERLYLRCFEVAAEHQKYADESRGTWARVCMLIGADPKHDTHYVNTASENYHVTLKRNGNKTRVELYATADDVETILKALKFKRKGEK